MSILTYGNYIWISQEKLETQKLNFFLHKNEGCTKSKVRRNELTERINARAVKDTMSCNDFPKFFL
jgi:hypothetical protein